MAYYAVHRTGDKNDELKHWKYIKKVRGRNGKMRYYYDQDAADAANAEGEFTMPGIVQGKLTKNATKVKVRNSDKPFGSTSSIRGGRGKNDAENIKSVNRGKVDQTLNTLRAKGERWIYDTFLKKKAKKN